MIRSLLKRLIASHFIEIDKRLDQVESDLARIETSMAASFRGVNKQLRNAERRAILQVPHADHAHDVQHRVLTIARLLRPMEARNIHLVRVGNPNDGGYVQLDAFEGHSVALSLGISDDVSWDLEVANRGLKIWQYDHSVEAPPILNPGFNFQKKKIGPATEAGVVCLSDTITSACPPGEYIILKMDIEGSEWEALDATPLEVLSRCSQIVCELHYFHHLHIDRHFDRVKRVLEKISSRFAVVHVHSNNFSPVIVLGNVPFFQTLEITFANRDLFDLSSADKIFPTPLDAPNNPALPDHFLGRFDFGE